jgi:hypothetical protein
MRSQNLEGRRQQAEGGTLGSFAHAAFCLAGLLLTLSGCSYYEPHLKIGEKRDTGPALKDVLPEQVSALTELENTMEGINTAADAKAAVPKLNEYYERVCKAIKAEKAARRYTTPADEKEADKVFQSKLQSILGSLDQRNEALLGKFGNAPPPEFTAAVANGKTSMQQAKDAKDESGPTEILATRPEGGTWMMWVLILLVMAVCAGFLFQEGIWGNCLRLVNVLIAGLLTMNFYEPVAKFLTRPGDYVSFLNYDLQSYVAFFDFLAFWICFIFFASILIAVTGRVSRVRVRFLQVAERTGSIVLSLVIGWVMSSIVLTSLHLAPLGEYPFLGCFQPKANMFLGLLAPDREWLGFTRYQSMNGYSRPYAGTEFPASASDPNKNFIDKNHQRRIAIERYVRGNPENLIRVNPQFIKK